MTLRRATELDLLEQFTAEMERAGVNHRMVRLNCDALLADKISMDLGILVTLDELQLLADKCLAHEWIEHGAIGGGKYGFLCITATGVGVVRSKQRKKEVMESRSKAKKISDFIEDHKGLFVGVGVVIALAGVLVKLFVGDSQ